VAIDQHSALGHHFLEVARAQRVGRVPAHAHQHGLQREAQPLDHPAQGRIHQLNMQWNHGSIVADVLNATEPAIDLHDVPEKITIDQSGANTAAVRGLVADSGVGIELRQSKYLNNLIEQDHRAVKRRTRPMLGFKTFQSAAKIIAGIETMHMIKKGQLGCHQGLVVSDADRFYSLATL
jgi:hypothetical protein